MLSNRIWIMPQRNRAGGELTAEVLYRCGSQQGRVATHLPLETGEYDFDAATLAFVVARLAEYRAMRRSKQKNPNRILKKYFDRGDILRIEDADGSADEALARDLIQRRGAP